MRLDNSYYYFTKNMASLEECRILCVNDDKCNATQFNPDYGCYMYSSQNFTFGKYNDWSTYSVKSLNADNSSFISK